LLGFPGNPGYGVGDFDNQDFGPLTRPVSTDGLALERVHDALLEPQPTW
jgi:hypothetical protein